MRRYNFIIDWQLNANNNAIVVGVAIFGIFQYTVVFKIITKTKFMTYGYFNILTFLALWNSEYNNPRDFKLFIL